MYLDVSFDERRLKVALRIVKWLETWRSIRIFSWELGDSSYSKRLANNTAIYLSEMVELVGIYSPENG
jgi:hypothetical protein